MQLENLKTIVISFSNSLIHSLKRQAPHIAPLQPLILAVFLPWGSSAGAGRVRPAGCKCTTMKDILTTIFYKLGL